VSCLAPFEAKALGTDMERLLSIKSILRRWAAQPLHPDGETEEDFRRRTEPNAPMTLLLRFMTESGPRTVVATGIPLRIAADIEREMMRAGHFADYIDEFPRLTMSERVKRLKVERAAASKARNVIKLTAAPASASAS
jgi:hypothetical protein